MATQPVPADGAQLLDPKFFIESTLAVVDRESRRVPFLLNYVQDKYLREHSRLDIILKARRMGFSMLVSALWLHACITRKNTFAVMVSHEDRATRRLFRRVKDLIKHSIIPINCKIGSDEITFPETDSVFYIGTAGTKSFGRGDDITHAHISEGAFYKDPSVITSVQQAMFDGGDTWFIAESTANGAGKPYHEFVLRAQRLESDFKLHFFPWFDDAAYRVAAPNLEMDAEERSLADAFHLSKEQIGWRRKKIRSMDDPALFPQEFPATVEEAFLASGRMIFDWKSILAQEKNVTPLKWRGEIVDSGKDVRVEVDPKGPLQIFRIPDPRNRYLIVADTGAGVPGGDFSVADVYDLNSGEQVAQWRDRIAPDKFSLVLRRLGCYYNWALIAVENKYPGDGVISRLVDNLYGDPYPNIYYEPRPKGQIVQAGFTTTEKLKGAMVTDGRQALRELDVKVNSKYTLTELKTFVQKDDGSMGAQVGCHDDTVITFIGGAYILKRLILFPEDRNNIPRDRVRPFRRIVQPPQRHGRRGIV